MPEDFDAITAVIARAVRHIYLGVDPDKSLRGQLAALRIVEQGAVDRLFKSGYRTLEIQYRSALEEILPNLTLEERTALQAWAKLEAETVKHEHNDKLAKRGETILPDPSPPAPSLKPDDAMRQALRQGPLARLQKLIKSLMDGTRVNWHSDNYSPAKAYVMACLAEVAYAHLAPAELDEDGKLKFFQPSMIRRFMIERRLRIDLEVVLPDVADLRVRVFIIGEYLYLAVDLGPVVVIAVRGTQASIGDWLINFNARKVPWKYGSLHSGFFEAANDGLPDIKKFVAAKPVYFTGHSQGAAVAAILTLIWEEQSPLFSPYLFACPRFGTKQAAERVSRRQYVQPYDFVPHLPPQLLGFSDAGEERRVLLPDDSGKAPYHNQLQGARHYGFGQGLYYCWRRLSADHHAMENYRRKLGWLTGHYHPVSAYMDALRATLRPGADRG